MKKIMYLLKKLNKKALLMTAGLVAVSLLAAVPAMAQLTYYTNPVTFQTNAPPLQTEDFETGGVAPGAALACSEPINTNSNDLCFSPGDINPGVEMRSSSGSNMVILGAGVFTVNNASIVAGANNFPDTTDVIFTQNNGVTAVGMDFSNGGYPSIFNINVYGAGNSLLGSTTVNVTGPDTFWGVISADGIRRINIESTGGNNGELSDNIRFGGFIPVPTMTEWGMIIFILLAGAGSVYYLRKRVSA